MTIAGVLAGRIAVVTGGASRIGAACALALAEAGADVALLVHEGSTAAIKLEGRCWGRRQRVSSTHWS